MRHSVVVVVVSDSFSWDVFGCHISINRPNLLTIQQRWHWHPRTYFSNHWCFILLILYEFIVQFKCKWYVNLWLCYDVSVLQLAIFACVYSAQKLIIFFTFILGLVFRDIVVFYGMCISLYATAVRSTAQSISKLQTIVVAPIMSFGGISSNCAPLHRARLYQVEW